jgi:hypothetical protein
MNNIIFNEADYATESGDNLPDSLYYRHMGETYEAIDIDINSSTGEIVRFFHTIHYPYYGPGYPTGKVSGIDILKRVSLILSYGADIKQIDLKWNEEKQKMDVTIHPLNYESTCLGFTFMLVVSKNVFNTFGAS